MIDIINDIWFKRRDIISDGYDESLNYIAKKIPMDVHKIPTGTKCWTWTIPPKWSVREAFIEDLEGRKIIDIKDHPLHVMSYSEPIDKIVTRDELIKHLHTKPESPDGIPYEYSFYERTWGFCLEHRRLNDIKEEKYRVLIDSQYDEGTLKVGDITVNGESEEIIVIAAHLCHPCMVNDGLSGVAALVEIAKEMKKRKNHYTYKFLIVPETIGSIAYLSQNEDMIPKMKYGVFLEMFGNDNDHALQLSKKGNTRVDEIAKFIMKKKFTEFRVR